MLSFPPPPHQKPLQIKISAADLEVGACMGSKGRTADPAAKADSKGTNAPIIGAEPCARSHPQVCHHSNRSDKTAVCSVRALERNRYRECFCDAPANTSRGQEAGDRQLVAPNPGQNNTHNGFLWRKPYRTTHVRTVRNTE